jgi:hypothetical protein
MRKRINIVLPVLREQLERAAVRDRDLDRQVAEDWLAVDRETWEQLEALPHGRGSEPSAR